MNPPLQFNLRAVMFSSPDISYPSLFGHTNPAPWEEHPHIKRSPKQIRIGGSDGVRTRDRPVKSRVLYLTKLQTQPADLAPLFNRNGANRYQTNLPSCLTKVNTPVFEAITTASHIPTNKPTSTTPAISNKADSNSLGLVIVEPNEQSRI